MMQGVGYEFLSGTHLPRQVVSVAAICSIARTPHASRKHARTRMEGAMVFAELP